ncbi:MAG: RagB/SusD family nutrient uptake outer membrane protein [Prevotella sp.]|nr:RagB/SusD family nutrient uptake outer membrane protein [Prevotella sp.]
MKYIIKNIIPAAAFTLALGMTSCTGDLDVDPIDPNLSTEVSLDGLFLKCYANLALPGNGGANGDSDIDGYDGGTAGFIRQMWNSNELPTDESICCWGDPGIAGFNFNQYDASHPMMHMYYYRLTTGINYCNSYLNEVGDGGDAQKVAEVRFIRALQYYMLMDAFGNIPFAEKLEKPTQISRKEAYDWIEKELLAVEPNLMDAKAMKSTDNGYGRATKGAAWMLLARLYLNAEVYTGTPQWGKAAEYAQKVINANYQLNTAGKNQWTAYQMLFMADNGETDAAYEAVFPILQDGATTTSWGGSLFVIASTFDGSMHANPYDDTATNNTTQAWGGNRARPELVKKFFPLGNAPEAESYDVAAAAKDDRALFCTVGRTLNVEKTTEFTNGYAVAKWTNFRSDNAATKDAQFPDTDFFLFRLAEAYLTYAEATARENGGNTTAEGTDFINRLRSRAHATTRTNASYSLNDIIDEWAREFYYEGRRRVDLIRFGLYGGNNSYKWQWKGGSYEGTTFSADLNIYAIPSNEISTNSNLTQNQGYK